MRKSIFETIIHSNIKNIWKIITDNEHYLWRSDISEIKIIEPHHKFIEVSKNGIQTVFTITAYKLYGFIAVIVKTVCMPFFDTSINL